MPLSTQPPTSGEPYVLAASLDNACHLSSLLRAIHFQDHATCFATANCLRVMVEDAKCIQANAFIQAEIFQEFAVQEESVMFWINLSVLLDCLTIFGTSSLSGMVHIYLDCVCVSCNHIVKPVHSNREISSLGKTSDFLTLSPSKWCLLSSRLSTFGNAGSAHLDYPRDSDLMEAFHCNQTQTNRYKISLLKPSTKALSLSCKVSIRTDTRGFLSLQYMIRNEDGQICFVEYYCCPDEDITEAEL
ncbi:RAD1 protein, partial [Balaeniceps rex]|nr:RAD1 protein [Balaeniceps rex]